MHIHIPGADQSTEFYARDITIKVLNIDTGFGMRT